MGNDVRQLLRRIALGLPLVLGPLGGCTCLGPCPQPAPFDRTLSPEQQAMFGTGAPNPVLACHQICGAVPLEGGALGDAGPVGTYRWTCTVDGEVLHCSGSHVCGGGRAPAGLVEAAPDAEQDVYRVRVYTASERDGLWWKPDQVLAERSYDHVFGQGGALDSIVVDFEGQQHTIEVSGLPTSAQCP